MRLGAKVKNDNSPSSFKKFLRLLNDLIFKHKTEKLLFSLKVLKSRELPKSNNSANSLSKQELKENVNKQKVHFYSMFLVIQNLTLMQLR